MSDVNATDRPAPFETPHAALIDPLADSFRLEGVNGEAAVLIHGFTGIPAHFRPVAQVLNERGYTVVAPRLAGHGTSIEDLGRTDGADWVASAKAAVDTVRDHRRVHLAGLSLGGLIAILLARPTAASTITTINSPVLVRDKRLYLARLVQFVRPMIDWPDEETPDLDAEVRPYWIPYSGFPTRAAAELVTLMRRSVAAARRLDRPSMVIQSRVDETVDPRSARILARALGPRCRLVWLDHSMHNALIDRERDVVAAALTSRFEDPT